MPTAIKGARQSDGLPVPVRVTDAGDLIVSLGAIVAALAAGDNRIGAVEIQDAVAGTRATVDADGLEVHIDKELPAGTQNIGDVDIASALPPGTNNIGDVDIADVGANAADVNAPAVNTAAVVTYAAAAATRHFITGVAWSYIGGIPVGGRLTVVDGVATVFDVDIAEEGPGFFVFPKPKSGTTNTNLVITLAAGGAGITGKVSILNHYTEA